MNIGYFSSQDSLSIRYGISLCQLTEKKGSIILLSGRAEFLEKYSETIDELNERGFDVYFLDWRGQGLSSRILPNRLKGYVQSYDSYISDLGLFIEKIVLPEAAKPLFILSHSLGGHILLRLLSEKQYAISGLVFSSPMIDIHTSPWPRWFARLITAIAVRIGLGDLYAIGHSDNSLINNTFDDNKLTSDPVRFMDLRHEIIKNPELAIGGVTYGWLEATFKSIAKLTEPGYVERVDIRSLIICAENDRVVCKKAIQSICARMPDCAFTEIKGSRHEILKEKDCFRDLFWNEFDRFINI